MKTVYVATKARGFLLELFNSDLEGINFIYDNKQIYETNSKKKLILSKLARSRIADHLGIIQRIKPNNEGNIIFSYNKFLNVQKDYVIYLENPLALLNYSTTKGKTLISKVKLKKYLNDPHLKAIVCLSKACYETIHNFYSIPQSLKVEQIYPIVQSNPLTNRGEIKAKCSDDVINCLYISSNFELKGGREILAAFKKLNEQGIKNIKLNIITKQESLKSTIKEEISKNKNITLYDFRFNREELQKFYNESCIFLNPTRQDSFSLVVLEAMKSGNTILTTDLYAIPEMVTNDENGYLIGPKYRFFNYNNLPNEEVWNNRKETIYSNYIDTKIVQFLLEKILYLNNNRGELTRLSLNSFDKSNREGFNTNIIQGKWNLIFNQLQKFDESTI
ncbi:glycosyltransferase family 4 protein [Priestia megaterium]|uniref:glycosyltransferase family 4 protein n=1 Tax=Priestia megaterium TaxID=1404 RepID=UPI0020768E3A|nr:glycosyltransferase family 4 protein [Priestia megaterium]USD17466.1 glycosyltransferase family 4 protein [Priestia megaterium]USD18557.1 glycosyltransferase family 4 protein [Priestia megaterium]